MKTTKIRLLLDFSIQTMLMIVFGLHVLSNPQALWTDVGLFALSMSSWQILHALYVVRKYHDWQRNQYLTNIRQVVAYTLLTVGIGLFMLVTSFGFLFPFLVFVLDILYLAVCGVVIFLAFKYFVGTLQSLYQYYYRPRSFWDLH